MTNASPQPLPLPPDFTPSCSNCSHYQAHPKELGSGFCIALPPHAVPMRAGSQWGYTSTHPQVHGALLNCRTLYQPNAAAVAKLNAFAAAAGSDGAAANQSKPEGGAP
jgi:hypothetical protein